MRDKLRRRYQVHKEVARNGYFEGVIALTDLERLNGLLYPEALPEKEGRVGVRFEFLRNEFDVVTITGKVHANLVLECQRCLNALELSLDQDFELLIDADDELACDSSLDSIYSEDGYIDVFEIVEDELILALPLVPLHEDSACNEHWPVAANDAETGTRENPFSVLRQLKTSD